MKNFIFKDKFIDAINKHKDKLKSFYEKEKNNLYFHNDLNYKNYNLCLINGKESKDNWEELKKANDLFIDIFQEDHGLIVPSVAIGKINGYPNQDWFIAHRHNFFTDGNTYHYVLNCNDRSGIIIGNEYLQFENDMVFGFNGNRNHIVFNFGETTKEAYIFVTLNKKFSLSDWLTEFKDYFINNKKYMTEMNKNYALKKIKKMVSF